MDFQVGEKVIYPNHGIGVVESIQTTAGHVGVYVLRILSNDSKVWVPRENVEGVGLRPVITSSASGHRSLTSRTSGARLSHATTSAASPVKRG